MSYAEVSTFLGKFRRSVHLLGKLRRSVLHRSVLRRTVWFPLDGGSARQWHLALDVAV